MRASPQPGPAARLARWFRPWLVASLGGLLIGGSLLSIDERVPRTNSYLEAPPRAANYDQPMFETGAEFGAADAFTSPAEGAINTLFAPAEPIEASSGFEASGALLVEP